jgi:hypothetical protein
VEMMQRYTRLKEAADEDDLGVLLVADAELFRLHAVSRWLDTADSRLRRLPRTAAPLPGTVERRQATRQGVDR